MLAADVLEADDAVAEQRAVARLPGGEVVAAVAAAVTFGTRSSTAGISGPFGCGPIAVPSGWSSAWQSMPKPLTFLSRSHSPASLYVPGQ